MNIKSVSERTWVNRESNRFNTQETETKLLSMYRIGLWRYVVSDKSALNGMGGAWARERIVRKRFE